MLSVDHIQKSYGEFQLNCSLTVPEGQVTGLIGQNGAGKSTTFKAILGLIELEQGKVTLFGENVVNLSSSMKEKIGVVLAQSGFSGYLTMEDICPIMKALYRDFNESFFWSKAEQFSLPKKKKIKDFSTGMKAKLNILLALSHRASLLILDEPTAGLDVIARGEILDLLREYLVQDEHNSILISSHIASDLEGLCDDIYMIHQGQVVMHEETDILLSQYGVLKVSDEQYESLDKSYVLRTKKETFGYSCLTNHRQFYQEKMPELVVENGGIDEVLTMMIRGEE